MSTKTVSIVSSSTSTTNNVEKQTATGQTVFICGGSHHRPRSGSAKEQTNQALEYYNNNVLKARIAAGLAGTRDHANVINENQPNIHSLKGRSKTISIINEINEPKNQVYLTTEHLHRSNSSLELIHDQKNIGNGSTLKRAYGSHGSIDVISTNDKPAASITNESFFAMLQDYRPSVFGVIGIDQRSPGPAEFLKGKVIQHQSSLNTNLNIHHIDSNSPKLKNKFHRFWGPNNNSTKNNQQTRQQNFDNYSVINATANIYQPMSSNQNIASSHSVLMSSADIEERQRRRAFAHFDCQSLTANLGYAAKLRELLLARRRNTTTGASAASAMNARSATPDDINEEDFGDGQCNELLENCPFFRNEIGNEEEREVSLTRMHDYSKLNRQNRAIHRPVLAYGISVLECPPNETLWKENICPLQKPTQLIESVDQGARYYRQYFQGQDHQNWFGMDEQLGPVAVSIKKEKLIESNKSSSSYQFRVIIRTSELLTLRGSVIEDSVPNVRGSGKHVTTKEVLEYVAPELQLNCLRLGINSSQCEQQLIKLDEQGLTNKYKVGILYCRAEQSSEEDMYNNEEEGSAFTEFLDTIGQRVRLKGFEHYKAGLDNKTDSTGTHSLYATYQDCEIMFHVSTMLPFTPNNRQQLLRKRHIGNDIVTIVFQEPGALPFTPKHIRSQFQHVFVIIRVVNPCSDNTKYRVAISRSKEVPVFGPPIPAGAIFSRDSQFVEFLLAKVINAENAAHRSEKFATMATRTRQEYLKDLATNYCTSTVVDAGTKFSIFPSKKKDKPRPRFCGDAIQRGAFCWQVVLQDSGLATAVDCFLGISSETFVLIEECSRQIVFVTPTKTILGWSTSGNSLRIYHHQGECVTINMRDSGERDEQLEVIERLRAVTLGCGAVELNLHRNPMGQLGFHVQPDGVVTQVETSGQAWTAGLRQGYRLVEICKVAVATLTHDQMVDLLKTSAQVTVTVIESFPDNSPRRGCFFPNCKFNIFNYEKDYDAVECVKVTKKLSGAQLRQISYRKNCERNFSPPRSSNSSGYGTGSSSRSFSVPNENVRPVPDLGTLTSSSSGHSSNDDRWYDIFESVTNQYNPTTSNRNLPYYRQNGIEHPRLTVSNSLTPGNNQRPLSVHDPTKVASVSGHDYQKLLTRPKKVENLMTASTSQNVIQKFDEQEQMSRNIAVSIDGNGLNSNNKEQIYNSKSISTTDDETEDPRFRRSDMTSSIQKLKINSGATSSSSASSSRNNSPRPHNENNVLIAAKLRPGVIQRNQGYMMQRNSANYTNSTLQEDLMKLINPDYISSDDSFINGNATRNQRNIANSHSLGNISILSGGLKMASNNNDEILSKKKSRSREAINFGQQPIPELKSQLNDNEILTTARPVTVVSQQINNNDTLNNTSDDNILRISEGSTPYRNKLNTNVNNINNNNRKMYENHEVSQPLPLLPDTSKMDWTSLVNTATRAMMLQIQEEQRQKNSINNINNNINEHDIGSVINDDGTGSGGGDRSCGSSVIDGAAGGTTDDDSNDVNNSIDNCNNNDTLPELKNHVSQLEDRILRETRRRKSLEHAVRRLTEENRRLQDESQAAVQQLRRFTEWFFQTIDRQS